MKFNKKIVVLSTVVIAVLFSACGSNGGSSSDGGTLSLDPVVAYSVEKTQEYNGKTRIMKLGADGDFKAVENEYGYPAITFSDSVTVPYTISTLTEVESFDIVADDTISGTTTTDYAKGTVHIKGVSSEHGDIDCTTTYQSPLPFVVNHIEELEDIYLDDEQMISTTCPSWMNDEEDDESEEDDEEVKSSTITNRTINGDSHISEYYSIK